jgi:aminopeptidase N
MEINNFYTMTVYQKGAEIVRMYHTLLSEERFQKGMQLYFERHDGCAVTCDDFLAAMADANRLDLEQFGRWYSQSGTPEVSVSGEYNGLAKTFTLHFTQQTPATHDQQDKLPLVIPVATGLLSSGGQEFPLQLAGEEQPSGKSRVLMLEESEQSFTFENITEQPVPSLLRGFSAPVKLDYPWSKPDLALLMAHDSDEFMRWEAAQLLAQQEILSNVAGLASDDGMSVSLELVNAYRILLADQKSDPALVAEAMTLPGEDYLAESMDVVDVDGIHAARKFVKSAIAKELEQAFRARYEALDTSDAYDKSSASMARRSLRNACLSFLLETEEGAALAEQQLAMSDNMTDTLAALQGLVWNQARSADAVLKAFEERWCDDELVMDKWFSMQASIPGAQAVDKVRELLGHPGFSIRNPNKVRSLLGVFSMGNPTGFHTASGAGYRLHAEQVIALDKLNPQVAARMAAAFNSWTRYGEDRRGKMKVELSRIAGAEGLSPDVSEIVNSALSMENKNRQQ